MKIYIAEWWTITLSAASGTPSDPPEIPENEPEGIPVEPPETIPQPDKGRSAPTNPNRYRPFLCLNIHRPARSIRASRQCVARQPPR